MGDALFLLVIVLAIFLFSGEPDLHDKIMDAIDRAGCEQHQGDSSHE